MNKYKRLILIFVMLMFFTNTVDANIEIRGTKATGSASWNAQNFAGFWYDIYTDKSTETLIVQGSISDSNRFIESGNLHYNTFDTPIPYKLYANMGKTVGRERSYYATGWQGQKYIAINGKANKLAILVLEQESQDKKTLSIGETWDIGDGWTLSAQSIDAKASPRQAWLVLSKDGVKKDDKVVSQGESYVYVEKSFAGESDVPLFVTYVDSIFAGATTDMVQLRYTWVISKYFTEIKTADKFGNLKVVLADDNQIALVNDVKLQLQKNSLVNIMGDLKFYVADNKRLIYYPMTILQNADKYTIRGKLAKGSASWNANNFAGLWYDPDSDQSTETLDVSISFNGPTRFIENRDLIYQTSAVSVNYEVTKAKGMSVVGTNYYKAVGWQGDKYLAIEGKSNKLARILLEQGSATSEKKTLTVGETWDLGNGYTLSAQSIDAKASPRQAWFVLSKDGRKLDDKVIAQNQLYIYESNFGKDGNVPTMVTYVDSVFAGATTDMVQLRYTFLASESAGNIKIGDRFGVFEVTSSNDDSIVLANMDRIQLSSGNVDLMGHMKFKIVSDESNFRFIPTMDITPTDEKMPIMSDGSESSYTQTVPTSTISSTYSTTTDSSSDNNLINLLVIALLGISFVIIFFKKRFRKKNALENNDNKQKLKKETIDSDITNVEEKSKNKSDSISEKSTFEKTKLDLPFYTLIIEVKNKFNKETLSKSHISLQNEKKKLERISDIDGKVIFGKVIEGVYNIKASLPGFEDFSTEITVDKNDRISIELKGKSNLTINVIDIANKDSISGATVDINGSKFITDEKGVTVISDISVGTYDINVTKDSFKQEISSIEVTGGQQEIKILLKPDIETNDEYIKHGEKIQTSLKEAMNKLSSACDMGIPEYYKGICLELVKFNEGVASTPVYVYSEQSNDKIEALYTITEQICEEIEVVLTNSENITEYISIAYKGIKSIPEISINPSDYDGMVQSYFENPADFLLDSKPGVLNKLQEIDAEITKNIQVFNINPVAHLWGISQIIVSGEKNEYEEGASILLINILLDCTRNMFQNEDITKRLKK